MDDSLKWAAAVVMIIYVSSKSIVLVLAEVRQWVSMRRAAKSDNSPSLPPTMPSIAPRRSRLEIVTSCFNLLMMGVVGYVLLTALFTWDADAVTNGDLATLIIFAAFYVIASLYDRR